MWVHFFRCHGPLLDPACYHLHDRDAKRHDLGDFQWRSERLTAPALEVDKHGFETQFCDQLAVWSWVGFFFSFPIIFISWRLITLQHCSGFCHTLTWISHGFTCVPHPNPPSHLPPHPIPLSGFYLSNLLLLCQMEMIIWLFSRAFCLVAYLYWVLIMCQASRGFICIISVNPNRKCKIASIFIMSNGQRMNLRL